MQLPCRHAHQLVKSAGARLLDGQLRENDKVIPFHLNQTGPLIRYSFTEPDEVLQLRLGENGSRLDLIGDNAAEKFPVEKLKEKVRGTGITYEDLTLEFLYWEISFLSPTDEGKGSENQHFLHRGVASSFFFSISSNFRFNGST